MKYKIYIIAFLFIGLGACSEEWLNDVEPQGKLLESNYYQTEEEMSNAMVAIYNMFKNQYWQGQWASWYIITSVASDDAVCHGGGRVDRPEMWEVQDYMTTPLTGGLYPVWNRPYYGIYRANVVIERVDPTTDFGKVAIAEAKMLRAYFYFDLVRLFGEVPLITKVLTPDEYEQEKVAKQDIFEFIVADLEAASKDLPKRWTGGDAYRMTKYAAHGLLAKVYAYMASPFYNEGGINNDKWALAETQAQLVIDEGDYELLDNFDDIWWYENEFNNETLIEMSYGYAEGEHWGQGENVVSNVIQQLQGPRGIAINDTLDDGWGFDMITDDLVNAYRAQGDSVRLHGTALAEWQMAEWGVTGFDKNEDYTGFYSKKRATWEGANPDNNTWGYSNNERILRLGEIYLILAEAQIAQGKSGDAAINAVRDRVNLPAITGATMDDLKLERRLELAMEYNRFFDLVRWGDAQAELGPEKGLFHHGGYTAKNAHFPIPDAEIQKTTKLIQNPLY